MAEDGAIAASEYVPVPVPEYVPVPEAAVIADVSPKTIYDWCRTGRVRSIRSPGGGMIRVLRADLAWRPRTPVAS